MSGQSTSAETVLVIGSTGNIGISAVIGALRSGRHVIAAVRNQNSAKKIFEHVSEGHDRITIVEADVVSDKGVQGIVDQVRAGKLPAFQHVYASVGGPYTEQGMLETSGEELLEFIRVSTIANFSAYRATIPYLLEQKDRDNSFTMCVGAQGDMGFRPLPAISQGGLFSMANSASHALAQTNVRFNEIYLALRVEYDTDAEKSGAYKASSYARVYENILATKDVKSCRVWVIRDSDLETLRYERRPVSVEAIKQW